MLHNPVWEIERVAEVQSLLDDHVACGKHSAADVVAKAHAILSEPELLRAMFDVGYFPPNTPPRMSDGRYALDCVAKVESCRSSNFSRKHETGNNRRFV